MPREKDPFRRYVTFLNENSSKWRCNFCRQESGGGATRIKAHLAGIGGFGIKGCERVDVDVRADAKAAVMAKRAMDSSHRSVSEERIQPNVRATPNSTSNQPDVEDRNPLQSPQGAPSLTPRSHEWMERIFAEVEGVNIANLSSDGATSYSGASYRPDSFSPNLPNELLPSFTEFLSLNGQQNPSPPLPSQNHQLLGNTFQNELQGFILPDSTASDAQLTNMASTNTPQHPNQPNQSFHRLCEHGTGLSPPRASMDIQPPISSQPFNGPPSMEPFNPPPQIPEDIINTKDLSTSKGNSNLGCDRPYISNVTSVTNTVPHFNKSLPRCNEESGTEISSFPLRGSTGMCPVTALQPTGGPHIEATHVNLQVLEGGANVANRLSSQVFVPTQRQSVPHQSINLTTAHRNPTVPSSSWENHLVTHPPPALMDMDPRIPSSSQAPNNARPTPQIPLCGTDSIGPSSFPESDVNEGAPMTSHPNIGNYFEEDRALKRKLEVLYSKEAGIRDELEFAESLSIKKPRMEIVNWLGSVEKLREAESEHCLPSPRQVDILMQEAEDFRRQSKGLFEARETKFSKFLEGKMVGEAFQRHTTKILEYLVGNQVSRLGIYGMGGVGKTTIMEHAHNRLLEKANYGNVLWITVSQDFNIKKLQEDIWDTLEEKGCKLEEKDVRKRASILSNCLEKRGKSTIILDDVWERFDLKEVGIPVKADGIKLVLTTRSFDVCRQMHCQETIKIEPLSHTEAESLFLEELGSEVALNLETKAVVKSIVNECAGLPLAVITMARSMQGVIDVFEWKACLEKLRESDMGQMDMEKDVLMKLEFSYNRLGNHDVQQCFLSCALYPEDQLIDKFELIEFFMDQGLIGGLNMREKQYDRGFTILNKLQNVCLLEYHGSKVKMHDLIRDMALHIMRATSIVKAGNGLMRIPPEEYWTDALEKVSLMRNEIREFPLNMSPNCPKLSTFLLSRGLLEDVIIPESFFRKLWGLKVLNLSGCDITELPNSISDLVNLRALLLRGCSKLKCALYLGKLRYLRKLDMWGCFCLEVLEGLEMLVNLKYLDLSWTRVERLHKGTLKGLLYLQYLKVKVVNGEDMTNLWALETLECYFEGVDCFNKCVSLIKRISPRYYELRVGHENSFFHVKVSLNAGFGNCGRSVYIDNSRDAIVSVGGENSGISILIPHDVQTLTARFCNGTTNLSGMGPLENLEVLHITKWENLGVLQGQDEEVISSHDSPAPPPNPSPTPLLFPALRILKISGCPKLKYLFGHGSKFYLPHLREIEISHCKEMLGITAAAVISSPRTQPPAFPSLEALFVVECDKMKRVVESDWLPHLPNLRRITVKECKNMEEIIRGPPPYMPVEEISLEFLAVLVCNNMRNLFPYEWLIHLRNLQSIRVDSCKGMVEMISRVEEGQEGNIMTPVNNAPSYFQSSNSLPKLKRLHLFGLPQLESICEVPISCDSIELIDVFNCPELNRIPLQLRLRDIEDLPYIEVESEEKLKTLTWDHPDAQAILQPYLHFDGSTCVPPGKRSHWALMRRD